MLAARHLAYSLLQRSLAGWAGVFGRTLRMGLISSYLLINLMFLLTIHSIATIAVPLPVVLATFTCYARACTACDSRGMYMVCAAGRL